MPQVRCPQCGAINGVGAPEYPFCVGCQDNLAKCGYCRWFDPDLVVCTNPAVAGVFDVAADATPPCDQHAPREIVRATGWNIWSMVLVGVVALLVLVYSVYQLQKPLDMPAEEPPESVRLLLSGKIGGATVGQPYEVTAQLVNYSDATVGGIQLQISNDALMRFRLAQMKPAASARQSAGEWMSYFFDDLAPKTTQEIALTLVPRKEGNYQLAVRLVSQGTQYHGMVLMPVRVRPAPTTE